MERFGEDPDEQAAAEEAGAIGGRAGDEDLDPAERPVRQAGGGEQEGFEQAEEDLERFATHQDAGGDPLADESVESDEALDSGAEYAEPDEELGPDR